MKESELLERIAELEADNRYLRQKIDQQAKYTPRIAYDRNSGLKYKEGSAVGLVVRVVCYRKIKCPSGRATHRGHKERAIRIGEMTEDEYKRYSEIVKEIVDILAKNADRSYTEFDDSESIFEEPTEEAAEAYANSVMRSVARSIARARERESWNSDPIELPKDIRQALADGDYDGYF